MIWTYAVGPKWLTGFGELSSMIIRLKRPYFYVVWIAKADDPSQMHIYQRLKHENKDYQLNFEG